MGQVITKQEWRPEFNPSEPIFLKADMGDIS